MFVDDESIAYMDAQRAIAMAITNDFCGVGGDGGSGGDGDGSDGTFMHSNTLISLCRPLTSRIIWNARNLLDLNDQSIDQ